MTALQALLIFLISFMVVAVLFKMPVSFALGTSSLLVLAFGGYNLVTVPQFAFSGLDSFALLAIPFYIFAGVIMEYSGISKMLIDWIKSFVGRIRGATGVITICACMAFGVLTGSAMATISAIGKMMVPELEKEGYPKAYNSALLVATCFLGILIPPSVPGIMYALASGGKISEIWMSTVGPASFLQWATSSLTTSASAVIRSSRKRSMWRSVKRSVRSANPPSTLSRLC